MEDKKEYEPPAIRKVRLEVKTSVLGNCSITPTNLIRVGDRTCHVTNCFSVTP